jgi:hypothetical protein
MTPKEKANELFNKMYMSEDPMGNYPMCFDTARECALIAVDEIMDINLVDKDYDLSTYWLQVKQEIQDYKKTKLPQFEAIDGEVNNITFDYDERTEKEQFYQTTFTMKESNLSLEEFRKTYDKLVNSGESIIIYIDKDGNLKQFKNKKK